MSGVAQTVGANVRRLRRTRGLSLIELGHQAGVAKGTLTQLEAGRGNHTLETIQALGRAGATRRDWTINLGVLAAIVTGFILVVRWADRFSYFQFCILTGRLIWATDAMHCESPDSDRRHRNRSAIRTHRKGFFL